MATKSGLARYTDADLAALHKKEEHPEKQVFCPRCGEEIGFRSVGNSYEVKCPTKDCIKLTVRGI